MKPKHKTKQTVDRDHEQQLMARYRDEDDDAFTEIYYLMKDRVFAFLHRRIRDAQIREDLAQVVFIKLEKALSKPENPIVDGLTSYCMRITFNVTMSHYRNLFSQFHFQFQSEIEGFNHPIIDSTEEYWEHSVEWVNEAIKHLTEREGQILRAYFWEGMSTTRIGEEINVTSRRIRQIIDELLERLRREFDAGACISSLDPRK